MILGIGIDIIEVARIAASLEKFGHRPRKRILLPDRKPRICLAHPHPAPFVATRFAAKENRLQGALAPALARNAEPVGYVNRTSRKRRGPT